MAVAPEHSFTRASDASPSWLGLPALAGCGSLPQSIGLRCSLLPHPRQTGGSDLCSRHQHASSGHSACFVLRVTQLFQISQVYHQLARDAGLVALAAAHASADLQLTNTIENEANVAGEHGAQLAMRVRRLRGANTIAC